MLRSAEGCRKIKARHNAPRDFRMDARLKAGFAVFSAWTEGRLVRLAVAALAKHDHCDPGVRLNRGHGAGRDPFLLKAARAVEPFHLL